MRVHHLNCISTCPLGGKLVDDRSPSIVRRGYLAEHCLLIETEQHGLVLVDTGLGLRDVADPESRCSRFFLYLLDPEFRAELTARRQVERLGFTAGDVRHIVLTHLDFDHAGGLDDFPRALVHLLARERDAAYSRTTLLDKMRYRPQQWSTRDAWEVYLDHDQGDRWFGFQAVRNLRGVPPEILLVPLIGHTYGHAGVAVLADEHWLLLAGDAYLHHDEMDAVTPRCPPGLAFYQWLMEKDRGARLQNQDRLRELAANHGDQVTVFCSHDLTELERMTGRPAQLPASAFVDRRFGGGMHRPTVLTGGR